MGEQARKRNRGPGVLGKQGEKGTAEGQGTVQSRASEFAFAGAGALGDEKLHREAV